MPKPMMGLLTGKRRIYPNIFGIAVCQVQEKRRDEITWRSANGSDWDFCIYIEELEKSKKGELDG